MLGEFHKDMRSFVDENIAGANMSTGRNLMRGEGRKREWFDGSEWHLGFPPHILDKMFMESPVHALDVVRAMGGDVEECHAFSRRAFTDYRDVHTVSMLHTCAPQLPCPPLAPLRKAQHAGAAVSNGCVSTVVANYTQPEGNRLERYEIHGHGITAHLEGVNEGWVRPAPSAPLQPPCKPNRVSRRGQVRTDGMGRDERIDISGSVGAGDGGTTEQLRYFTDAVLNDTAIDLPAANFEEAIKTMTIAEETLNATPDDMSAQLKAMIAASEAGAQGAWRGGGDGEGVEATAERLARL